MFLVVDCRRGYYAGEGSFTFCIANAERIDKLEQAMDLCENAEMSVYNEDTKKFVYDGIPTRN